MQATEIYIDAVDLNQFQPLIRKYAGRGDRLIDDYDGWRARLNTLLWAKQDSLITVAPTKRNAYVARMFNNYLIDVSRENESQIAHRSVSFDRFWQESTDEGQAKNDFWREQLELRWIENGNTPPSILIHKAFHPAKYDFVQFYNEWLHVHGIVKASLRDRIDAENEWDAQNAEPSPAPSIRTRSYLPFSPEDIQDVLNSLSGQEQEFLYLLTEMSLKELADFYGQSIHRIRNRKTRLLKRVKKLLERETECRKNQELSNCDNSLSESCFTTHYERAKSWVLNS